MRYGICTDVGLKRDINEDYYGVIESTKDMPSVFIIADGMGGHQAGEVASKLSVELTMSGIREGINKSMSKEEVEVKLKQILEKVNKDVYDVAREDEDKYGMGTTLTAAVVMNGCLVVAHVGDSRLYSFRDNKLKRITTDHSYVEELVQNGTITTEEALDHPKKNILTRVIGYFKVVEIDTYECVTDSKETFLMCTDGLTNMVSESRIKEILSKEDKLQSIANSLVKESNKNGGVDNTTVIVFGNEVADNGR
ncbi:MAG: Stp1/IreP family PP2C-type Ser/Thr phosphatase [Clostridiales bacterium]|nr:Stp1/IreP family PP2C-type Ser/Thr phosphatase [Clostridiales bacterium]